MKKELESFDAGLMALKAFAAKYANACTFPEEMMLPGINPFPSVTIYMSHAPNRDGCERLLSAIGDTFGREGWTRSLNYSKDAYDWQQTVEGVRLLVHDAEPIENPLDQTPVPPTAFPRLLEYTPREQVLSPLETQATTGRTPAEVEL